MKRARKDAVGAAPMPIDRDAMIRVEAYYAYERNGCVPGRDLEDWLEAEAIVDALLGSGIAAASAPKAQSVPAPGSASTKRPTGARVPAKVAAGGTTTLRATAAKALAGKTGTAARKAAGSRVAAGTSAGRPEPSR
jgi:hypothetical protein